PITITTDIRNLPRDFMMIWFKKPKDGGDSVFLGYYRFDMADEDNTFNNGFVPDEIKYDKYHENADFDLTYILGYSGMVTNANVSNSGSAMAKIRSVVDTGGFKLVLNNENLESVSGPCTQLNGGFDAGDAVYYVLYTPGSEGCGTGLRRYRSEDFVPNLIESRDYSDMPLVLTKQGSDKNCPTAPMVVVASIEGLPDDIKPLVHYEWRYDGRLPIDNRSYYLNPLLEGDLFPDFSVKGEQKDTLYVTYSPSNIKVTCRAILDFSCGVWGGNKYKGFDFSKYVSVDKPDFTLTHIEADTVVCAGSEVTLWAQANEKNAKYKNKRKAARAAAEYEYAWCTEWAGLPKEGHCNIDHDTVVGMFNSSRRVVIPAPAVVPDGYMDDWNGTDGVVTYYLSVHHRSSDCWAYDSVALYSFPDKDWNVSLEPTIPGIWCDIATTGPMAQKIYLN
ncbi:MAG: hypothetical protein K2K11_01405, partial [Bacteroidales bacterium]|nr:hypothetical protein [Bacteroidales bacterium]